MTLLIFHLHYGNELTGIPQPDPVRSAHARQSSKAHHTQQTADPSPARSLTDRLPAWRNSINNASSRPALRRKSELPQSFPHSERARSAQPWTTGLWLHTTQPNPAWDRWSRRAMRIALIYTLGVQLCSLDRGPTSQSGYWWGSLDSFGSRAQML